jgi:hypothetical protein
VRNSGASLKEQDRLLLIGVERKLLQYVEWVTALLANGGMGKLQKQTLN